MDKDIFILLRDIEVRAAELKNLACFQYNNQNTDDPVLKKMLETVIKKCDLILEDVEELKRLL